MTLKRDSCGPFPVGSALDTIESNLFPAEAEPPRNGTDDDFPTREMKFLEMGIEEKEVSEDFRRKLGELLTVEEERDAMDWVSD